MAGDPGQHRIGLVPRMPRSGSTCTDETCGAIDIFVRAESGKKSLRSGLDPGVVSDLTPGFRHLVRRGLAAERLFAALAKAKPTKWAQIELGRPILVAFGIGEEFYA